MAKGQWKLQPGQEPGPPLTWTTLVHSDAVYYRADGAVSDSYRIWSGRRLPADIWEVRSTVTVEPDTQARTFHYVWNRVDSHMRISSGWSHLAFDASIPIDEQVTAVVVAMKLE